MPRRSCSVSSASGGISGEGPYSLADTPSPQLHWCLYSNTEAMLAYYAPWPMPCSAGYQRRHTLRCIYLITNNSTKVTIVPAVCMMTIWRCTASATSTLCGSCPFLRSWGQLLGCWAPCSSPSTSALQRSGLAMCPRGNLSCACWRQAAYLLRARDLACYWTLSRPCP